ncbi:MAG: 2,3-bisphosphoglycerate-independent phosphoglycerate mutase [Clostridiales bacterium]|nr:2,3-bisphosphoglycerate-independent phosphoglycerate mutase [Clostridiales bacterium]
MSFLPPEATLALIVLDGWGLAPPGPGNAVTLARTPHFDRLWASYPHTTLEASGRAVGLVEGQMGNSNVGHLNIGAGRVVLQDLPRIDEKLKPENRRRDPRLQSFLQKALQGSQRSPKSGRPILHLWGLLSDGGVHSHMRHLFALLEEADEKGLALRVHAALDGRDTPPMVATAYVKELLTRLEKVADGKLVTLMGRYYAMDRDRRWDRTEKAFRAMVEGIPLVVTDPLAYLEDSYREGTGDEFIVPAAFGPAAAGDRVGRESSLLCWNFRADRARQLTQSFIQEDFVPFARPFTSVTLYGGLTLYEEDWQGRQEALFPDEPIVDSLGEVVSRHGYRQLRIAETEKYAHVTYFFNGGEEKLFPGEDRILVPSPKVATYDLKPEMSAPEVARRAVEALRQARWEGRPYRLMVLNFANPDMVGHTGVLEAAIQAVEATDRGLGEVMAALQENGGGALVLADHGNAEQMIDPETGGPWTAHTTNPVPFILAVDRLKGARLRSGGILGDVAPTALEVLQIPQPPAMTGQSLLEVTP